LFMVHETLARQSPPKLPVFGTATMRLSAARRPSTAPSAVPQQQEQQQASDSPPPAIAATATAEDYAKARESLIRRWEAEVRPKSRSAGLHQQLAHLRCKDGKMHGKMHI
jgi:hypothetical protein